MSFNNLQASCAKTQKGLVSRDTSPFVFPVRIRSALAPLQNSWWSWRRELNPRPSDYKSDALPAELRQRRSNRVRIAEGVSELQVLPTRFLARGWPALWKNACTLDRLDTRYPVCSLQLSTESSQPQRSEFNSRESLFSKRTFRQRILLPRNPLRWDNRRYSTTDGMVRRP